MLPTQPGTCTRMMMVGALQPGQGHCSTQYGGSSDPVFEGDEEDADELAGLEQALEILGSIIPQNVRF